MSDSSPPLIRWYVIRAKPHRERFVSEQLRESGLEVFYPAVKVQPINPRSARERAYFPGYLFVHADLDTIGKSQLNYLPGAMGMLEFGGEPAIVPEALVTQLKRRIATIQAAGGLALIDLKHGDVVRITAGPLAGYDAIFDMRLKGADRARVLLDFLQKRTTTEIDAGHLRKLRLHEIRTKFEPRSREGRKEKG
jgi:transcriptional antiterminator RfaH